MATKTKKLTETITAFSHKDKTTSTIPKGTLIKGLVYTGIEYCFKTHHGAYSASSAPKYTIHEA